MVRASPAAGRRRPLGKASQGDAYFVAPNPAFGAIFTVHLGAAPKTARDARREAEKGAANALFPPSTSSRRRSASRHPRSS